MGLCVIFSVLSIRRSLHDEMTPFITPRHDLSSSVSSIDDLSWIAPKEKNENMEIHNQQPEKFREVPIANGISLNKTSALQDSMVTAHKSAVQQRQDQLRKTTRSNKT